jgi:hypothetical protein
LPKPTDAVKLMTRQGDCAIQHFGGNAVKRFYEKPTLEIESIALGVYGAYGGDDDDGGNDIIPKPFDVMIRHPIRME